MNSFIALDVETANENPSSICQIGLAWFEDNRYIKKWASYVNPQAHFDEFNINIHGITPEIVKDAPKIKDIFSILYPQIENQIIVHHTPFDRLSLNLAVEYYGAQLPAFTWLDSARVVRRTYEQYRMRGYSLSNLSEAFGITYQAHDAAEDARAAGLVLLRCIKESNIPLDEWTIRAYQRNRIHHVISQEGNPDGPMFGEVIVFTGALKITRVEAARLAAEAGCTVTDNVNKRTTILVVGDQDLRLLAGYEKSSKQRRAEELRQQGQLIRIIDESDFTKIVTY